MLTLAVLVHGSAMSVSALSDTEDEGKDPTVEWSGLLAVGGQ